MFDEFLAEAGVSKEHLITSAAVAVCWVVLFGLIKLSRPAGRAAAALARRTARAFRRPPPPPYAPSPLAAAILEKLAAPGWKAHSTEEGVAYLDYRLGDGSAVRRVTVKSSGGDYYCTLKIDDGPDQVTHAHLSAADCREITRVVCELVKRVREEATLAALGAKSAPRVQKTDVTNLALDAAVNPLLASVVKQAAPRVTAESVVAELPGYQADEAHLVTARSVPPGWFSVWKRTGPTALVFYASRTTLANAHAVVCSALVNNDDVFVIAPANVLPGSPDFRLPAVSVHARA